MKKILSLATVLFSCLSFAQQRGDVVINWSEKQEVNYGDYKAIVPLFSMENFHFNTSKKEIFFDLKLPQSTDIAENSLQITNIVYEPMTAAQLGSLSTKAIPGQINATLHNLRARDKITALITLSPIIKDGTGYKKIKSFTYSFNASASRVLAPNDFNSITNSVLASGEWFRFYVVKSGVYYINKSFLQLLGINANGIDPRKIKIYGNGGRMIPLKNSIPYPEDLTENAIQVLGEDDGVFNDNDYVAFYAEGVDNWNDESQTTNNLYSDKSYYYINVQGADGKRIQSMLQPSGTGTPVTTFNDYQYHEVDAVNIVRLGRRWFGEVFDVNNEQEFNFNIPNIATAFPVSLTVYAAAAGLVSTSFKVEANGQLAGNMTFNPIGNSIEADSAIVSSSSVTPSENIQVKLTYDNHGVPSAKGYLDYIFLKSTRNLKGYGKQFRFQYDALATGFGVAEFQMSSASAINQVWDITDIYNVTKAENTGQANFSFKTNFGELRKYVAVDMSDLYVPSLEAQPRVANQNLKGTIFNNSQGVFQDIDYIIVTPAIFSPQAERLANFHRSYSGLNVKVVTLESIYQEFSSGKQDIGAVRNFMKYVYYNATTEEKRVKYLNLFGDASYDFKNRVSLFSNFVPIYHSLDSYTTGESSFCSDDFFALMDDNEGYIDGNQGEADIAVGRMIAGSNLQDCCRKTFYQYNENSA